LSLGSVRVRFEGFVARSIFIIRWIKPGKLSPLLEHF